MAPEVDADIARLAAGVRRGSIIAAAGCGKTEQIARAVGVSEHRRLILTHTHAGVDALTRRLKKLQIPSGKYRIDTIAGWPPVCGFLSSALRHPFDRPQLHGGVGRSLCRRSLPTR